MAQATKTQKVKANVNLADVAADPAAVIAQVVEKNQEAVATAEAHVAEADVEALVESTEAAATEAEAAIATETVADAPTEEAKKRQRNYSQSAINTEDLERLNGLKAMFKDKLKMNVSNQRIISRALDFLGQHAEEFLNELAAETNDKQKQKDLAKLAELKQKLGVE